MSPYLLAVALCALIVSPAYAQDVAPDLPQPVADTTVTTIDVVPPQTTTIAGELPAGQYPILRLTPDKINVMRLDRDAVNVIVGNASHLLAVMETPRQVLLVPRQPGATHFQVLDARGNTIMERSVIVAAPKQDYIRVRRACATKNGGSCEEFSIFYCPDMCHTVNVTQKSHTGTAAEVPMGTASSGGESAADSGGGGSTEMINDQPVPASAPSNTAETMGKAMMIP